jgi:hypothetical protein
MGEGDTFKPGCKANWCHTQKEVGCVRPQQAVRLEQVQLQTTPDASPVAPSSLVYPEPAPSGRVMSSLGAPSCKRNVSWGRYVTE